MPLNFSKSHKQPHPFAHNPPKNTLLPPKLTQNYQSSPKTPLKYPNIPRALKITPKIPKNNILKQPKNTQNTHNTPKMTRIPLEHQKGSKLGKREEEED